MDYSRTNIVAAIAAGLVFLGIAFGTFELIRALVTFDPVRDTARELGPALRR